KSRKRGGFSTKRVSWKVRALLAALGFEFVETQASFAIALVGRGLPQNLGLIAILVDACATRKTLSQRDFRRDGAGLNGAPESFDAVGFAPGRLGRLRGVV